MKVLYYIHPEFDAGVKDVEIENPKETNEGIFHGIINEIQNYEGHYFSISKILIESLVNHDAIRILPKQLIRFID